MKVKLSSYLVFIIVISLFSVGVIIIAFVGLDECVNLPDHLFNSGKDTNLSSFIKLFGAFLGGLLVLWGLIINIKRVHEQTKQNKIAERGQIGTRFKDATILLTQESVSANLAGIYALHQIAVEVYQSQDQTGYIKVINELLCAYVRENCPVKRIKGIAVELKRTKKDIIIQTIIDKLARDHNSKSIYKGIRLKLSNCNLSGLTLGGGCYKEAFFDGADLRGVLFGRADLEKAMLINADIYGANFVGSELIDVPLDGSIVQENFFQGAKLSYMWLHSNTIYNIRDNHQGEKYRESLFLIKAFSKEASFTEEELKNHFVFTHNNLRNSFLIYNSLKGAILIMDSKEYALPM